MRQGHSLLYSECDTNDTHMDKGKFCRKSVCTFRVIPKLNLLNNETLNIFHFTKLMLVTRIRNPQIKEIKSGEQSKQKDSTKDFDAAE